MHWEEAARGLVDVHDAVYADCVLDEPEQLDEQPVRVMSPAEQWLWSSFKHLAGFLKLKHVPRKSRWTTFSGWDARPSLHVPCAALKTCSSCTESLDVMAKKISSCVSGQSMASPGRHGGSGYGPSGLVPRAASKLDKTPKRTHCHVRIKK